MHQEFVFYTSGVYYNPACGNTDADLDHEVLAVGFGTDPVVSRLTESICHVFIRAKGR